MVGDYARHVRRAARATVSAMAEPLYWCCAELLTQAVRIPQLPSLPPPQELRQRLVTELDAMVGRGRAAGIADADLAEARYALTAFIDEQILKSNWPGRAEWMGQPLQLMLYNEYTAGENFFHRARALLQRPSPPPALEIYYLCLAAGFRGAYGVTGDSRALAGFTDSVRQRLVQTFPPGAKLAPRVEPSDRLGAKKASNWPLIAVIVGTLLVALLVVVGLERLMSMSVDEAVDGMRAKRALTER
jgi:type VI secretion system protein ImpK